MIKKILFIGFLFAMFQGNTFAQQSLKSASLKNSITSITSILPFSDQMTMYPNPAAEKVLIGNDSNMSVEVTLFNIVGDPLMVKQSDGMDVIFNLSSLSDGVYIVAFNNGKEVVTKRLVKKS